MNFNNLYNTPASQRFAAPTWLFHGPGTRSRVFELLPSGTPAILVFDSFFSDHAFLGELRKHLGVSQEVSVAGEPTQDSIDCILSSLADRPWTALVALGGGSTLDTAKALLAQRLFGSSRRIGYGDYRDLPDLLPGEIPVRFIALPTTAGTGSEMSRYYLVSDSCSHEKMVGRSWALCPHASILDPHFLVESPRPLLVLCAFDAFSHLWETLLCRQECSPIVEALAVDGISRLVAALLLLESQGKSDENIGLELQLAAAFGGMALSNVRTGILHDAGETLAAQCPLPHPSSLYVFFSSSLHLFAGDLEPRLTGLQARLSLIPEFHGKALPKAMDAFWTRQFENSGCSARLRDQLQGAQVRAEPIIDKIMSDQVLIEKEAPRPLSREPVTKFVVQSLAKWMS